MDDRSIHAIVAFVIFCLAAMCRIWKLVNPSDSTSEEGEAIPTVTRPTTCEVVDECARLQEENPGSVSGSCDAMPKHEELFNIKAGKNTLV